jgi:hypothetical protein
MERHDDHTAGWSAIAPRWVGACRSILVAYASAADDAALHVAIAIASEHRAPLTVAVPIGRPPLLADLAGVDLAELHDELETSATRIARIAAAQVPDDVSLRIRCVARAGERELVREIERDGFDLCIFPDRIRGRHVTWERMGRRLRATAHRHGVATLSC